MIFREEIVHRRADNPHAIGAAGVLVAQQAGAALRPDAALHHPHLGSGRTLLTLRR